jgi:two-component system, NarL family, invasion response regulator UvrY
MIEVVVADDHAIVRRGVIDILNEEPDLAVVAEASSGQEVLQIARQINFDVLVLDMGLPDMNGLEVLYQLKMVKSSARTLILSIYPEEQYGLRALKAGAMGYLTKESAPIELVAAIHKIAQGERYISAALSDLLVSQLLADETAMLHTSLSNREYQVMLSLANGRTISDIAVDLSLSVKTISTYRSRIIEKLNLETTSDIIRYALRHNLVE